MKILLVEDDTLQAERIRELLEKRFRHVDVIRDEREFCSRLDELVANPPDVAVIDVMLPWGRYDPQHALPPREVQEGGYQRAGIRCVKRLLQREETRNITIIIYSMLEREDLTRELEELPPQVCFLTKQAELHELVESIYSSQKLH
ncbi:MAG: response regulator [Deltaproteobacteria bacterium]|nr:response regulator [Deltaproteobacteria bacterium]